MNKREGERIKVLGIKKNKTSQHVHAIKENVKKAWSDEGLSKKQEEKKKKKINRTVSLVSNAEQEKKVFKREKNIINKIKR